ncbi:MAG: hypothetical protein ACK5MJ_04980 [Alphaproteobacteria bacterium]
MKKQVKNPIIMLSLLLTISACSSGQWGWKNNSNSAAKAQASKTTINPQLKAPTNVVSPPSDEFTGHYNGVYFVNGKPKNNAPGSGVPLFEHPAEQYKRTQSSCKFSWLCK